MILSLFLFPDLSLGGGSRIGCENGRPWLCGGHAETVGDSEAVLDRQGAKDRSGGVFAFTVGVKAVDVYPAAFDVDAEVDTVAIVVSIAVQTESGAIALDRD